MLGARYAGGDTVPGRTVGAGILIERVRATLWPYYKIYFLQSTVSACRILRSGNTSGLPNVDIFICYEPRTCAPARLSWETEMWTLICHEPLKLAIKAYLQDGVEGNIFFSDCSIRGNSPRKKRDGSSFGAHGCFPVNEQYEHAINTLTKPIAGRLIYHVSAYVVACLLLGQGRCNTPLFFLFFSYPQLCR